MLVLPEPGGPMSRMATGRGAFRRFANSRFGPSSPMKSSIFRGWYFSVRGIGYSKPFCLGSPKSMSVSMVRLQWFDLPLWVSVLVRQHDGDDRLGRVPRSANRFERDSSQALLHPHSKRVID